MKTTPRNGFIAFIVVVMLAACAAAAPTLSESVRNTAGDAGMVESMPAAEAPMPAADMVMTEAPVADQKSAGPSVDRIVIVNVDMSIVVDDPAAKLDSIAKLAERMGGFVVSSNIYQTTLQNSSIVPEGYINVRVPAGQLDTAIAEIKNGAVEVQSENRNGQDVTDQYVDLQSQLKAKQSAETKLYEILAKAETAEDTLLVFNQLSQVQSDIEVLKGQINYYDQASALSSINVHLVANESIQPIEVGGWKPQGVAKQAVEALIGFFQGFVSFLIWLFIFILPVVLVLMLVLWIFWKLTSGFWKKLFKTKPQEPKP